MKDDEAALYDLAIALHRDKKVSGAVYKAALDQFGERGIMDVIGIIGFYDITSMTLITMQAAAPNDSVPPLPALSKQAR
jgi:4-carboxymuconolactone decarboxylase